MACDIRTISHFFVESECVKIVSWNGRLWIVKGTCRFDAMICRNWPYGPVAKHYLFSSGHTKAKKHWCLKMVYIMVYPKIEMFRKGKWWETDGIEDTPILQQTCSCFKKSSTFAKFFRGVCFKYPYSPANYHRYEKLLLSQWNGPRMLDLSVRMANFGPMKIPWIFHYPGISS
jgi:hypothetical protein